MKDKFAYVEAEVKCLSLDPAANLIHQGWHVGIFRRELLEQGFLKKGDISGVTTASASCKYTDNIDTLHKSYIVLF